jgi:ABC-type glutathione transport system ATPase component
MWLGRGVTILFVSHDFKAVADLCARALWLENGHLQGDGRVTEILRQMKGRYHWNGEQICEAEGEVGTEHCPVPTSFLIEEIPEPIDIGETLK